jgi:short-subunit dehydrogenase
MNLRDRHVLITGGSRGIGLAVAREAAARGARVTLVARRIGPLEAAARVLGGHPIAADLSDLEAVARIVPDATAAFGPVDVLVNNAAQMGMGAFANLDAETVRATLTTNLLAHAELTRSVSASMVQRRTGTVVVISSLVGETACRNIALYGTSKAALSYLVRTLQREFRGTGVVAQQVLLGGVDTELLRENLADPVAGPASQRLSKAVRVPSAELVGAKIIEHIERDRRRPLVLPAAAIGMVGLRHLPTALVDLLLRGIPPSL